MRMKATGIWPLELVGNIIDAASTDDGLVMHLRTTTPAGWDLTATLTHEDVRAMLKLLLKPGNLKWLVFGFTKKTIKDEAATQ